MRVLLVEDNQADADLVRDALEESGPGIKLEHVSRLQAATMRLERERFDVIVLDLSLPDATGLDALVRLREIAPSAPIVVLTGMIDSAASSAALEQGAQDFLQKGQIGNESLLRAIRAARERQLYVERARLLSEVGPALSRSQSAAEMIAALVGAVTADYAALCTIDGAIESDDALEGASVSRAGAGRGRLHAVLSDEPAGSPERARCEALLAQGMRSAIVVRFSIGGRSDGVLTLARNEARVPFGPMDVGVAEEIAARLTSALEHATLLALARREQHRAEVANQLRDEFLATLSHELRTPLNAILGWTQMLRAGQVAPEKQGKALETIERNTLSQVALIEDVLDVSRIITGKMRLDIREVLPAKVVASALETVRPAADAKGVQTMVEADPDLAPIHADPDRLQQVLWNLLANAVKFTPRGGTVHVRVRNDGGHVEVAVTDTGQGIPPEFLPHVFERFRQADSSMKRSHSGLGLGLAITRQLVELHGGTVAVASDGANRGATFTVRFPTPEHHAATRAETPPPVKSITGPLEALDTADITGVVVLIVDDDPDTRDMLRSLLETAHVVVTTASSAEEGFRLLCKARPTVLISDVGMPGATGYDLIARVRGCRARTEARPRRSR